VFVALVIQQAERMHPPSATCLAHFTFSHKGRDFQENIITHKKRGGGTLLVTHLVEALRYKPEGRGSDSRWCQWNFSLT
jgi:hypothetical protein